MKKKLMIISVVLLIGVAIGTVSKLNTEASNNVVLASVEWVNSKLNPLQTKVTSLENQIAQLQTEINNLKNGSNDGGSKPDPTPPPTVAELEVVALKNTAVRRGALTSYATLVNAKAGETFKYIETFTNNLNEVWYIVELKDGRRGAIISTDVQIKERDKDVVITRSTSVRRGALSSYDVMVTAKPGDKFKYISSFVNQHGETWFIVELKDGRRGAVISTHSEVK